MIKRLSLIGLAAVLLGAGCSTASELVGLSLPEGDPAQGKVAFTAINCFASHAVVGHNFPAPYAQPAVPVALAAGGCRAWATTAK